MFSLVYGQPCALNIDPVEKKPLLHFHPGEPCLSLGCTGCNMSCRNCQNWEISQAAPLDVPSYSLGPDALVQTAKANGCRMVAFTYTEPLTYIEYTRDCAKACKEAGLSTILVTAAFVNKKPLADLLPYIDAANVDLKSFSEETYRRISNGGLHPVLNALCDMKQAGVWVEVTNLLIPGVNDDPEMVRYMCRWLVANGFADNPLHFSRFFPQYRMKDVEATPIAMLRKAKSIALGEGLHYVYVGNTGGDGDEDTVCPYCGELLVKRNIYKILQNRLSIPGSEGVCPRCGKRIAGVWNAFQGGV